MSQRGRRRTVAAAAALAVLLVAIATFLSSTGGRRTEPAREVPSESPSLAPPDLPAAAAAAAALERMAVAESENPPPSPAAGSLPARPETLVYGSLLDSAGQPIRGAWSAGVSFIDSRGRWRLVDAKAEGAYVVHALPYGSYWVTAGAYAYRTANDTIDLTPERPILRKDFTLPGSVVLKIKVVTPDGRSLFDAFREGKGARGRFALVPVATLEAPGTRFFDVSGSLINPFGVRNFWGYGPLVEKLPAGYFGVLVLTCDLPVHVSLVQYHVVLDTRRVEPGTDEVVFVVSPETLEANLATIRVRVVASESGEPIAGAWVDLEGASYTGGRVATDQKGEATMERCEPGRYELTVRAEGREEFRIAFVAEPGEVTDLGEIRLGREVTIAGRFVDPDGSGVSVPFEVGVFDPARNSIEVERYVRHTSDGTGSFRVSGLGRKTYVIRTSNHDAANAQDPEETSWVSGNVFVDARAGSVEGVEIPLEPGTLVALRVSGRPVEGMRFRVTDEGSHVLVAGRFYGPYPRPLDLPRGLYRVGLVDSAGTVLEERSLTVGTESVVVDLGP
jgi:hypothetical protein